MEGRNEETSGLFYLRRRKKNLYYININKRQELLDPINNYYSFVTYGFKVCYWSFFLSLFEKYWFHRCFQVLFWVTYFRAITQHFLTIYNFAMYFKSAILFSICSKHCSSKRLKLNARQARIFTNIRIKDSKSFTLWKQYCVDCWSIAKYFYSLNDIIFLKAYEFHFSNIFKGR